MPQENQNDNFSVAKCWIYLKTKNLSSSVLSIWTMEELSRTHFHQGCLKPASKCPFWASMKAKRNNFEIFYKVNIKMSQSSGEIAASLIL